jgi:hypothetical protein
LKYKKIRESIRDATAELQVKIFGLVFTSGRGWSMTPRGLSYNAFNLPSQPDHKYIWFRVGISVTLFKTDSPVGWG